MRLLALLILSLGLIGLATGGIAGQEKQDAPKKKAAKKQTPAVEAPATDPKKMKVAKGFQVELIHSVPMATEGSWVSMCSDPKGRLIVCDQDGGLYRVTPPPIGKTEGTKVERIPADIGGAQGLLWAFDKLYVMVNARKPKAGLYAVSSSKNDDVLDKVELLRELEGGGGEHGPHAIVLTPGGKSITVICGNQTKLPKIEKTLVPPVWGEDHILPRMPDGRGFMAGVPAPGGFVCEVTPDGKEWKLISNGFRNPYDVAYHRNGDLFTYDADMEWDMNTPWYRPTRICLVTPGSEFGWRNGAGKWPAYFADSLPAVHDVGPGSPTGVCFGYGAKFPAKYQEALFFCDWSYGKLYALHLKHHGASYTGEREEIVTGTPLPLTDMCVNSDGALYFAIGGRKTKSALYRLTYTGTEGTAPIVQSKDKEEFMRSKPTNLRRIYGETLGTNIGFNEAETFKELGSEDRFVRSAARSFLEWQPLKAWQDLALSEPAYVPRIQAIIALARVCDPEVQAKMHAEGEKDWNAIAEIRLKRDWSPNVSERAGNPELQPKAFDSLFKIGAIGWANLNDEQRCDLLRAYGLVFLRMAPPTDEQRAKLATALDPFYPSKDRFLNAELCKMLVYLQASSAAKKTMELLTKATTQEEQMEYAVALRNLKTGWTKDMEKAYFQWLWKSEGMRGGNSFNGFIANIKKDAIANLPNTSDMDLKAVYEKAPPSLDELYPPRPFVKKYTVAELLPEVEKNLTNRDYDRGKRLFGEAKCAACHRFDDQGGSFGPNLTVVAGRFSLKDVIESVIEPSKVISDQYEAVVIETTDGKKVTGRIINLHGDTLHMSTDMLDPNKIVNVGRAKIESMEPSKVSMMPEGLYDTLKTDEIYDLTAYLLSKGDRRDPMFKK